MAAVAVEVVDGGLGLGGGGEQRGRVGTQNPEPVGAVAGVVLSWGGGAAEVCAGDRGAELGDEFLGGVGGVAEPAGEVSGEAGAVSGPVAQLLSAPAGTARSGL